ncbi:MAG TPA: hypothetical protein VG754_01280 [Verrucomicrobiae bacterium]|nr:hypothetical protein [Verrucomicrobiae bacterium]
MTAAEILQEFKALPISERARVVEQALRQLTAEERKPVERLIRRLQHPEVPESFWEGVEDHEDGRSVEMDIALKDTPPGRQ